MAAQDYVAVVQQLYISYFGRPADTFGLKNFTEQLDALKAPTDFVALNAAVQADKAGTGALSKLVNSFNASDEAKALYGTDNSALGITKFLISVFQNVLGREPEAGPGFDFWFDALASGHLRRADAAMAITEGALSNTTPQGLLDAQTVLNKRAVATDFTDSLDTPTKQAAYSTAAAVATASGLLKGVTADTDVTAYHADVVTAVDAVVTSSIPTQNLTLTAGVDTINGGNGNDIINGVIDLTSATGNTFTSLDTIDGKAGNDTLNLNILNGGTTAGDPLTELPGVTVTNVETANIRAAVDITADVSDWSVSTVNVTQGKAVTLTASSTAAVNVSGTTGVVDINGGKSQNISVTGADVTSGTVGAAGDDTAGDVTISVAQVAGHDVIVTGGANVNVTTTGATTGNTINIGQGTQQATGAVKVSVTGGNYSASAASAAMGGITVKGGTSIEVDQVAYASTANAATDTTTVSTRTQGAVSIDGAGTATTVTVNQSKAVTAKDGVAAVAGVKQAATYTFGVLLQGQTMTVAGLTFTAAKDLTAAEVATAFANLAASAAQGEGKVANGSYTGAFAADWTSAAANGATVTFTAKTAATAAASALAPTTAQGTGSATLVQPTAGATVAGLTNVDAVTGVAGIANGQVTIIDSGTVDKIATVNLNGYATGSTIASDALTTLNIANSAGTLAVTNTVQKTLDLTVNGLATGASVTTPTYETINMHVAGASTFGVTATGAKALVVDGSATANISGATGVATTFGNLESVKVNGTAGLNMGATASGSLKSVDTTGTTGTVTVSIDGTKATYTGGAGVDNVTLVASAAITKAVNLGAGDDSLTFTGTNVPTVDGKIDGGAGTNTLVLAAADAATLSLNANFEAAISNFQKLSLGAVVAGATNAVDLANLDDISYVISANAPATAAVAQVSTAVITSTGTSDAGDTASITVGGTVFTTAAGIMTEDGIGAALAALIDADPAYVAAYNATNNTITVTAAVAGTAFAAPSAITITNAGGGTVDTISAVYATPTANGAAAAAGSLALTHMANDGTLELTGAGAGVTVTMTDATGAADSLNVKITNAASINVGTVAAAGVETLKVQLDDTDTTASAITAVHTLNISDAALKSLVLTGDAGGIVTHNSNVVTSIDGSALTLSLTAGSLTTATAAATITGGAGNDILTANHTGDVLIGGAGSDTLKLGGASNAGTPVYANGVTLTGGAGNDIFDISGAGSVVATVNDYATITDFSKGDVLKLEAGNLKFVAAGVATGSTAVFQDLVNKFIKESAFHDAGWFQYQGDTYVVEHLSGAVTAFVNGTDNIVKITGLVDLSNVGSYSDTGNTLLIFA